MLYLLYLLIHIKRREVQGGKKEKEEALFLQKFAQQSPDCFSDSGCCMFIPKIYGLINFGVR